MAKVTDKKENNKFYGAKRIRTADPLNAIEVLYQLSYNPLRCFTILPQLLVICQVGFYQFLGRIG